MWHQGYSPYVVYPGVVGQAAPGATQVPQAQPLAQGAQAAPAQLAPPQAPPQVQMPPTMAVRAVQSLEEELNDFRREAADQARHILLTSNDPQLLRQAISLSPEVVQELVAAGHVPGPLPAFLEGSLNGLIGPGSLLGVITLGSVALMDGDSKWKGRVAVGGLTGMLAISLIFGLATATQANRTRKEQQTQDPKAVEVVNKLKRLTPQALAPFICC